MNKFEILAQAKTRREKRETQVSVLSNLAIPIMQSATFVNLSGEDYSTFTQRTEPPKTFLLKSALFGA